MKYKPTNESRIKSGMTCLLLAGLCGLASAANIAYVPKAAPGDTATAGAGKQWPTTRFVVNGDCITDNLTGLMWAKNGVIGFEATDGGGPIAQPNYANTTANLNNLSWSNAAIAINNMNTATTKLCGYSDWRLPNQKELLSLFNYAVVSGNQANWLNTQGFTGVEPNVYWSSTAGGVGAWRVLMLNGSSGSFDVTYAFYVLPVRGGQ